MAVHWIRRIGNLLGTVALALGLLAAAGLASGIQGRLEGSVDSRAERGPELGRFAEGDLVARVHVSRLGLGFDVLEGVRMDTLARAAGHLPETSLPGEPTGNRHSLIALPRDFRGLRLSQLRLADTLDVKTPFGARHYTVIDRRILPPAYLDLESGALERLTFVTPYPADSIGPAPMRLAIVAEDRTLSLAGGGGPPDPSPGAFSLFRSSRDWLAHRSASPLRSSQLLDELRDAIDRSSL
jgi:sortase (surface protein transpeptidase)